MKRGRQDASDCALSYIKVRFASVSRLRCTFRKCCFTGRGMVEVDGRWPIKTARLLFPRVTCSVRQRRTSAFSKRPPSLLTENAVFTLLLPDGHVNRAATTKFRLSLIKISPKVQYQYKTMYPFPPACPPLSFIIPYLIHPLLFER